MYIIFPLFYEYFALKSQLKLKKTVFSMTFTVFVGQQDRTATVSLLANNVHELVFVQMQSNVASCQSKFTVHEVMNYVANKISLAM